MAACGVGFDEEPPPVSSTGAELSSQTLTFSAVADARVESATPTTNYGTSDFLRTEDTGTNVVQSYLKFTVAGTTATVRSARLRMYITDGVDDASPVYAVTNTTWVETGTGSITWSNKPAISSTAGVDPLKVPSIGYVEWDVTNLVTGDGTYSFALVPASPTGDRMNMRSRDDTVYPHPELVVITAPTSNTFPAVADAYVNSDFPGSNYGTSFLWSRPLTTEYPEVHTYMRFTVSGITGTVTNARVRLHNYEWATDGPHIHPVSDHTWIETGTGALTWSNKPTASSTVLDDKGPVPSGMYYEWDVTDAVTGNGTYDFALLPDATAHSMRAASREDPSLPRPELVVLSEVSGGGGGTVVWPISNSTSADADTISDPYGPRLQGSSYDFHAGVDIPAACTTTDVHAVLAGKVVDVEPWDGSATAGNHIIIEHDPAQTGQPKRYTSYLHLSSFASGLQENDLVDAGDVIGKVGMTGATFCHLHFTYMLGVTPNGSGEWSNQESKSHNPLELLPHTAMSTPSATIGATSTIQLSSQKMEVRKVTIANATNSRTADYYTIVSVPATRNDQTQAGIKLTAGNPVSGIFPLTLEADPATFVPDRVILEDIYGGTMTLTNGGIAPAAPTNIAAESVSSSTIEVIWDPVAGPVDGYRVYRGSTLAGTVPAPTTTYSDSGRSASTAYTYKVVAYHGSATSADSASVPATTHKADTTGSGNGIGVGTWSASATQQSIGVRVNLSGDNNFATTSIATGTARYRALGTKRWKHAHPLFRINFLGANTLAGSIMFLEPGTAYEVLLYLQDPDGGARTILTTVDTDDVPSRPTDGNTYYVIPGTGGGSGTFAAPFRGITSAKAAAEPGDIFRLRPGTYAGTTTFDVGGTDPDTTPEPNGRIVWMADDPANPPIFNQIWVNASWQWFEGLKFRDVPSGEDRFVRQATGPDHVVMIKCDFAGALHAMYLSPADPADTVDEWYIADNLIVGTKLLTGDLNPQNGEGIELRKGLGNVVAYNTISRMADAISQPGAGSDIYGNDIYDITDDGIEADDAGDNLRMWGNRMTNVHNGFSFQYMLGAPWYVVRNQWINGTGDGVVKLKHASATQTVDRFLLAHNTIVQYVNDTGQAVLDGTGAYLLYRGTVKNNLWITASGSTRMWDLQPGEPVSWRTSIDYNGFDYGPSPVSNTFKVSTTYSTLAVFSAATGLETHGITLTRSACFNSFAVPSAAPAQIPLQTLTLKSTCPGVNAGTVLPNISDGYGGAAPDLGALELGAATPWYGRH